ncbi:MAG TPA: transposase [Thermoguttaceae bacterium]|nr:transposase [Thermoguttaceae bacterium]
MGQPRKSESNIPNLALQTFDPNEQYAAVVRHRLPHWSQPGTITFITWRTWDSMPAPVVEDWLVRRDAWLRHHGINPLLSNWRSRLDSLPEAARTEFKRLLSDRWNDHLDALHGQCVLSRPEFTRMIADSLIHFDGDRYVLTDYVVMPNHVHVLAAFSSEEGMLQQCESWKHFTARQINQALCRKGQFWQQDDFDHLVRSSDDFDRYRLYIGDNPIRARLNAGQFLHYSKPLTPKS